MPTVLVVENSPTQARLLANYLAEYAFEVLVGADGWEGIQLVRDYRPDVVVLSGLLPKLDGFQVCRRLKRSTETAHIPVILLTDARGAEDAAQVGADGYVMKGNEAFEQLAEVLYQMGLLRV